MDDQPHPEIIIVKRRANHEEEHHGGAWKIAFADFMTAMMAFFLVLWIINATDKNTKSIIARYFNAVKLEEAARTPKSIHGDNSAVTTIDVSDAKNPGASGAAGPQESSKTNDDAADAAKSGDGPENKGVDQSARQGNGAAAEAADPTNPKPAMSEGVLFADPYRGLDAIAGPSSPNVRAIAQSERVKTTSEAGSADPDAFRDPFRPIGHELAMPAPNAGGAKPPPAGVPTGSPRHRRRPPRPRAASPRRRRSGLRRRRPRVCKRRWSCSSARSASRSSAPPST